MSNNKIHTKFMHLPFTHINYNTKISIFHNKINYRKRIQIQVNRFVQVRHLNEQ